MTAVFDSRKSISVSFPADPQDKVVTVNQLSDEQLSRRRRAVKFISRDLGRGVSKSEPQVDEKVDLKLFEEVKISGDELDGAEAGYVLDQISFVNAIAVEREGSSFVVFLKVLGEQPDEDDTSKTVSVFTAVKHVLGIPTIRQQADYGRQSLDIKFLPHGKREMRSLPEFGAQLFDRLVRSSEGYADGSRIPITHKAESVSAVINYLNRQQESEAIDPENF